MLREARSAQLSPEQLESRIRLIDDVYGRRGTAPEIRAAVQSDCIEEGSRLAQAGALAAAAAALVPAPPAGRTAADVLQSEQAAAAGSAGGRRVTLGKDDALSSEERKAICRRHQEQLDQLRDAGRTGGSIATMERLNAQRRDLENRLRDAGC